MWLPSRSLNLRPFFIDTNMINARGRHPFMNLIEKWYENDVITLRLTEDAQDEAEAGFSRNRILKARSYIVFLPGNMNAEEQARLKLIQRVLCGSKPMSKSDQRDARIVFTAAKYYGMLITADGASNSQARGILGAASELKDAVGVQIMSAASAVELIRRKISERDNRARCLFAQGQLDCLPAWVGRD